MMTIQEIIDVLEDKERELENVPDEIFNEEYHKVDIETTLNKVISLLDRIVDYEDSIARGTVDDDKINEQIGGRPLEFENGEVFYVECEDGYLYAGHMTNAGIMHEYEMHYNNNKSLEENLQNLVDNMAYDLDL